jgi:mono/diheme cytochrome c family protein
MQGQVVGDPNTMAAYDTMLVTDADVTGITAWLQAMPAATTGQALFTQHCSFCHGANGKGGATEYATAFHSAPFVRQTQATFRAYVKAGHTSENGVTIAPSDRRGYMPPFANLLTDAQLDLIFAWAQAQ